ncbi:hypothetical protein ACHAWF_018997 [Thalassiosira exigua]
MAKRKKAKAKIHERHRHPPRAPSAPSPPDAPDPDRTKRKRPRREGSDRGAAEEAAAPAVVPHAIRWLERRKMKVPDALRDDDAVSSVSDANGVLRLLPGLRERERRALARHLEKCLSKSRDGDEKVELEDSDGEYDVSDASGRDLSESDWPADVEFSNDYRWDPAVPVEMRERYAPSDRIRRRAPRLSSRVYFKRISDPDHPAHGEFGLYCALPHAPPGSWLLDYVGHVTLGENQDKESDYVSDFGDKSELACDANSYGNEARFLNDFRNTGKHPNVEFNKRRDKNGELRQGVYVKLKKDAKEEGFDGVRRDEELLVSYGKSYWRSRVGNLTDFVWRLPGRPMPEGGKPGAAESTTRPN